MEVKQLPAQPIPASESAHYKPANLYEHFMAFLSSNNQNGFADDNGVIQDYTKFAQRPENEAFSIDEVKSIGKDTIAGLLITIASQDFITYKQVLNFGYQLKEVSNRKIKLHRAQAIVARAMGYYDHNALHKSVLTDYRICEITKSQRTELMVKNRRDRSTLHMKFLEQLDNQS